MSDGERKASFYGARRKTSFQKTGLRGSVFGEVVMKEGYLEKKGRGVMKQWQSRYFELAGHYMSYSEKKGDDSVKGTVDLAALETISAQGSHILIEMSSHQNIELKATSPQVAVMWVTQIQEVCDALGTQPSEARKGSYTAVSSKETTLLRTWAEEAYEEYLDEDMELFMISSLNTLCTAKGLLGDDLSEADLKGIFESVKVKKKFLGEEQYLEALRKIATKKNQTFEELVELISGKSLDDVDLEAEADNEVAPAAKKDEFEKIDTLGGGGQGTTILVMHKPTKNQYAAKLIMCPNLEDAKLANDEARLMKDMRGPQFVEFKAFLLTLVSFPQRTLSVGPKRRQKAIRARGNPVAWSAIVPLLVLLAVPMARAAEISTWTELKSSVEAAAGQTVTLTLSSSFTMSGYRSGCSCHQIWMETPNTHVTIKGSGAVFDGPGSSSACDHCRFFYVKRRTDASLTLVVSDITFQNGRVYAHGGAMYIYRASVTLNRCRFNDNTARHIGGTAGGMYIEGGTAGTTASVTLTSCSFSGNAVGGSANKDIYKGTTATVVFKGCDSLSTSATERSVTMTSTTELPASIPPYTCPYVCTAATAGLTGRTYYTPHTGWTDVWCVTTNAQLLGLSKCTSIDYLYIISCADCTQIAWCGLQLQTIMGKTPDGYSLYLGFTPGISDMCGVKNVNGALMGVFRLSNMHAIVSLDGAEGITSVAVEDSWSASDGQMASGLAGSIVLDVGPSLTRASALNNAGYPAGTLYINGNTNLECVPSAWPATDSGGRTIYGHSGGGRSSCTTTAPTAAPTTAPTASPTATPTDTPTDAPTDAPTASPTASASASLEQQIEELKSEPCPTATHWSECPRFEQYRSALYQ
jgi:hypothetical protein